MHGVIRKMGFGASGGRGAWVSRLRGIGVLGIVTLAALPAVISFSQDHPSAASGEREEAAPEPPAESAPNPRLPERVIMLVLDSVRADRLGFMGYARDTSPYIDGLAKESVVFTRAISPSHTTAHSVGAFFAGRWWSMVQSAPEEIFMPQAVEMLPEVLAANGVHTACWTSNAMVQPDSGIAQGFKQWHMVLPASVLIAMADEVVRSINALYQPTGGREFLYIHLNDPHRPYRPRVPWDRLFVEEPYERSVVREGTLTAFDGGDALSDLPFYRHEHAVQPEDVAFLETQYDAAIRWSDSMLPVILDAVRFDPAKDILILTSDHGEQFFEHGFWAHAKQLYPEEVHVPLLVHHAGFKPTVHHEPVSWLDLHPTIASWLDSPPAPHAVGRDLSEVFAGAPMPPGYAVAEAMHHRGPAASVFSRDFLYTVNLRIATMNPAIRAPYLEALFDLRDDPGAQTNVIDRHADTAAALNAGLREANPRFAPARREALALGLSERTYGPDLLADLVDGALPAPLTRAEKTGGSAFALQAGYTELSIPLTFETLWQPYLIEFAFELDEGAFELFFEDTEEPGRTWRYKRCTPAPEQESCRWIIYNRVHETRLVLRMLKPGTLTVGHLRMRKAQFPPMPWAEHLAGTVAHPDGDASLSDHERMRLEAIGYTGDAAP